MKLIIHVVQEIKCLYIAFHLYAMYGFRVIADCVLIKVIIFLILHSIKSIVTSLSFIQFLNQINRIDPY